jgi:hypothetical protein
VVYELMLGHRRTDRQKREGRTEHVGSNGNDSDLHTKFRGSNLGRDKEVPASNRGQMIGYPKSVRGFPQSLLANETGITIHELSYDSAV